MSNRRGKGVEDVDIDIEDVDIEVDIGIPGPPGPPGPPGADGADGAPGIDATGMLTHLGTYRYSDPLVSLVPAGASQTQLYLATGGPPTTGQTMLDIFTPSTGLTVSVPFAWNQDAASLNALIQNYLNYAFETSVTGGPFDSGAAMWVNHTGDTVFSVPDPVGTFDNGTQLGVAAFTVGGPPGLAKGVYLATLAANEILETAFVVIESAWSLKFGPDLYLATKSSQLDQVASADALPSVSGLQLEPAGQQFDRIEFRSTVDTGHQTALVGIGDPLMLWVDPAPGQPAAGSVHIFGRVGTWEVPV